MTWRAYIVPPALLTLMVGATTMDQLRENIDAFEEKVTLSEATLKAIDAVHMDCRDPCMQL